LLVARERFDSYDLPLHHSTRRPAIKKVRKISARTKVFYCAVVVITMCLAFMLTSKYAQMASVGYEIDTLKKQAHVLDTENQALHNELAGLKSLDHIEYLATTKLGMQKPELAEGVQFVPVEYSIAGSDENISGKAAVGEMNRNPQAKEKKNSLVQALVNIING